MALGAYSLRPLLNILIMRNDAIRLIIVPRLEIINQYTRKAIGDSNLLPSNTHDNLGSMKKKLVKKPNGQQMIID